MAVRSNEYGGDETSLVAFVVSLNLHRRHLDESQRAMVAGKLANLKHGQRADASIDASAVTQRQAAELLNVSRPSVQLAREVLDHGAPELVAAVERGEVSVSAAAQASELPIEEQREVVAEIEAGEKPSEVIKRRAHVSQNSGNNEWYTPPRFIEGARRVMGSIDTDPATSEIANKAVCASTWFTEADDGRKQAWRGNVWMNPPYAQPLIADFCEALAAKVESGEVSQACVLVNNGTETAWFQRLMSVSSAVLFPRSRVRFIDQNGVPGGAPLQGQALVYCGPNWKSFAEEFAQDGAVLVRADRANG
jgi:ParB family chromosome partitioning protein